MAVLESLIIGVPIILALGVFSTAVVTPPSDIVLSQISVTGSLERRGYDEQVISNLIHDEIDKIENVAATYQESKEISIGVKELTLFEKFSDVLKFQKQVESAQITLGMIDIFADIHFYESRDGLNTVVHVRLHGGDQIEVLYNDYFTGPAENPHLLFRMAAETIVKHIDPYQFASFLFNSESQSNNDVMVPEATSTYPRARAYLEEVIRKSDNVRLHRRQAYNPWQESLMPWYYNLLGLIAVRQKDWAGGIEHFETALEYDRNFPFAHVNWGLALLESGSPGAAVDRFRRAADLKPDMPITYVYWAKALERLGKPREAVEKLDVAHRVAPNLAYAYAVRAEIARKYGVSETYVRKYEGLEALSMDLVPRQAVYLAM